jgi:hypothetical protein
MARPNPLRVIMSFDLPSKTLQRRLPYRPDIDEVLYTYEKLNRYVFDRALKQPEITINSIQKAWGVCYGLEKIDINTGSNCKIRLMDKWFCIQWMVTTLAHEMCHQFQWDIYGPEREEIGKRWLMSHGPSFLEHRTRLAEYNIPLKVSHSKRLWFKYQDLFAS